MIDSFYRIRALSGLGIKIHLHCFEYGRDHSAELEKLCKTIHYYPRKTGFITHLSFYPYIVCSRRSEELEKNLLTDNYPILFDGLHTTFCLNHPGFEAREIYIRLHNIEHRYYRRLASSEKNPARKLFYIIEAFKLKQYQRIVGRGTKLLSISGSDNDYFNTWFGNSEHIPAFHPFSNSESRPGSGKYILYHGDLSVNENKTASEYLITKVFKKILVPCIIAGKDPPVSLCRMVSDFTNIEIIGNPSNEKMQELIMNAHINVLISNSSEGFKVKLLMALFSGRHCIVNDQIVNGTGLEELCFVANSGEEISEKIRLLMQLPFSEQMIKSRSDLLKGQFDTMVNAERISRLIFGEDSQHE